MLLTYGGTQAERFKEALKAGTLIVCVNPKDVLSLDLDRGEMNQKVFRDRALHPHLKHSGPNGNYPIHAFTTTSISGVRKHVYIPLRKAFASSKEYHDWAVKLGSDPEREKHSYERYLKAEELNKTTHDHSAWLGIDAHPWVLFETPEQFEWVRKWYRRCDLKFQSISFVDPETNTYDTEWEGVKVPNYTPDEDVSY